MRLMNQKDPHHRHCHSHSHRVVAHEEKLQDKNGDLYEDKKDSLNQRWWRRRKTNSGKKRMLAMDYADSERLNRGVVSSAAVIIAGGNAVFQEAIVEVKTMAKILPRFRLPVWSKRCMVLEDGHIRFSNERTDGTNRDLCIFKVIDLIDVEYLKRGDAQFCLRFRDRNQDPKRSIVYDRSSSSSSSDDMNDKSVVVIIKSSDVETILGNILLELRSQALLFTTCTSVVRKDSDDLKAVELLLRQAIDFLTLACGEEHSLVLNAEIELAEVLRLQGKEEEANLWTRRSRAISERLKHAIEHQCFRSARGIESNRDGLSEIQHLVDIFCKANVTDGMVAKANELKKREENMVKLMQHLHEQYLSDMQNKASKAEERAIRAEKQVETLKRFNHLCTKNTIDIDCSSEEIEMSVTADEEDDELTDDHDWTQRDHSSTEGSNNGVRRVRRLTPSNRRHSDSYLKYLSQSSPESKTLVHNPAANALELFQSLSIVGEPAENPSEDLKRFKTDGALP